MDISNVHSKETLVRAFSETTDHVHSHFAAISDDQFFSRQEGGWASSDQLEHLLKSVKPVMKALKTPRMTLRVMFGTAKRDSNTLVEIRETYLSKLKEGVKAFGKFLPSLLSPEQASEQKAELLEQWKSLGDAMIQEIEGWNEADLDKYLLPHPILGKLTVREMLFFTLYHNHHHSGGAYKT